MITSVPMPTLGMNINQVRQRILQPEKVLTPFERMALGKLKRHGGLTRRTMQQMMRPGTLARVSEYPEDLRRLLDSKGRDAAEAMRDIRPRPKRKAKPNAGPLYWTKLLRKHIYFIPDAGSMSVITGVADLPGASPDRTPQILNEGGIRTEKTGGEWVFIYEGGRPTKVRLAKQKRGQVRYREFGYAEKAHDIALTKDVPDMYRNSIR